MWLSYQLPTPASCVWRERRANLFFPLARELEEMKGAGRASTTSAANTAHRQHPRVLTSPKRHSNIIAVSPSTMSICLSA